MKQYRYDRLVVFAVASLLTVTAPLEPATSAPDESSDSKSKASSKTEGPAWDELNAQQKLYATRTWNVHVLDMFAAFGASTILGGGYEFGEVETGGRHGGVAGYGLGGNVYGIMHDRRFRAVASDIAGTVVAGYGAFAFTVEPRIGAAVGGDTTVPVVSGSFGWSIGGYAGFGYTFQLPIALNRPEWLTTHFFHLQVRVPVHHSHKSTHVPSGLMDDSDS